MSDITEFVTTVLDTRATTEDGLTFNIHFTEFNDGEGALAISKDEAARPDVNAILADRYNTLRDTVAARHGFTAHIWA